MPTGILGKKIGVTQVFTEDGRQLCVTAIEAGPCPVLSVREKNLQLGFDLAQEKRMKKPLLGYFQKMKIKPCKLIREVAKDPAVQYAAGQEVKVDIFKPGDYVDVTGTSLGKGFQGGMKRWHWKGGSQTHGSTSHRRVGSMGSSTTPGRVFKGHHLPGHMGMAQVTVQNLEVVNIDLENNLLLIKGAVPGHKNGYLVIRKAKKKTHNRLEKQAQAAAKLPAKPAAKAKPGAKK